MYLEKLEIQGFKSFANKNVLIFPGMLSKDKRGITAIVGPNGSGKSNIADAVRWALGEQSLKTLRGKKSEDVIFSGSDKKGQLSMAEVCLFLNNEDRQAPLDYSEIILTRRFYRNGESEYSLNNNRVRLIDTQILLAKSNFGQKTYSVIGQGLVEGFLNTSLAERKEFFDEATGVKQFQIKRDDSVNKLISSYDNLNQAKMLIDEIEPRLKSLTRQVNKLKKRSEIETELKELQLNYYGKIWHEINEKFNQYNKKFLALEKIKLEKEKKLTNLNREFMQAEQQSQDESKYKVWQKESIELQNQKDIITKNLAKLEAITELKLESSGQFDLVWINNKKTEIIKEIETITEEITMLEKNINYEKNSLKDLDNEKNNINKEINKFNNDLIKYSSILGYQEAKEINNELKKLNEKLELAEKEDKLIKIKQIIREIRYQLQQLINLSTSAKARNDLENIQKKLISLTQAKEEISTKLYESNFRISARSERVKLLAEKKNNLQSEMIDLETKLTNKKFINSEKNNQEQKILKEKQIKLELEIKEIKEKIYSFNLDQTEKRKYLFSLQKNLQNLQQEINLLTNQLNDLKINSTKYETRLEDLEIEIRNNLGNLKEIREHRLTGEINAEFALEKITALRRQIEQIGGIDPEIDKEYIDTKGRFDFLSSQSNDLTNAINSLEKIVKELDLIIKEKFDREFKNISTKFEQYFKILFNGGQAKIIKVLVSETKEEKEDTLTNNKISTESSRPEDKQSTIDVKNIKFLQKYNATGLAGIEIQATPPGKKIKSIAMLSGGERALTAIALICAIISANPSPFVVLDEVDASLDEANSERLAKILDDLSHKTQFIVITHNRATMRRANVLYGVTMGNDGVSRLLSIKLDQAQNIDNQTTRQKGNG